MFGKITVNGDTFEVTKEPVWQDDNLVIECLGEVGYFDIVLHKPFLSSLRYAGLET